MVNPNMIFMIRSNPYENKDDLHECGIGVDFKRWVINMAEAQ